MKQTLLKIVNPILLLSIATQIVTVVLIKLVEFGVADVGVWVFEAHSINGLVFFGLFLIHIVLNWNWIVNTFFKKAKN